MNALLIDPETRTLTEVETSGRLSDFHTLIGCDVVNAARVSDKNSLFFDDEGLFKKPTFFFQIANLQPIAGRGLLIGTSPDGGPRDYVPELLDYIWFKRSSDLTMRLEVYG